MRRKLKSATFLYHIIIIIIIAIIGHFNLQIIKYNRI